MLERLKKKYGPSLDDVLRHREACARELDSLERIDERTAELKARLEDARAVVPRGCQSAFVPAA